MRLVTIRRQALLGKLTVIRLFKNAFFSLIYESRRSLCSSGQSSWLQIQRSGFDSRRYQILWEVVGLERGPLSLVSTTEELLGRKSSGTGLDNREYGHGDPLCWPCDTPLSVNFVDKRQSLGRYCSLADSDHGDWRLIDCCRSITKLTVGH
jgi:hypothetical protein